jgi:L-asparaginase II
VDPARNPVLVELTRGSLLESLHTGALAVMTPDGAPVLLIGDVTRPVYPRSSVKAFQCLAMMSTGAPSHFGFGAAEIALACASHSGRDRHVKVAASMLKRAGLNENALSCGAHEPADAEAARALVRSGATPTALHNNCSGKHAGMLATAVHMGEPVADYWRPEHPVQQRVADILSSFCGLTLRDLAPGIDGCSAPNWPIPLRNLATAFAKLGSGQGVGPSLRGEARGVLEACWVEPEMMAGAGRLDTILLGRFPGRIFLKTGAEGIYCGAIPGSSLGFALKIDDGAKRASELAVQALISRLLPDAADLPTSQMLPNWRGLPAAEIRCSAGFLDALPQAMPG